MIWWFPNSKIVSCTETTSLRRENLSTAATAAAAAAAIHTRTPLSSNGHQRSCQCLGRSGLGAAACLRTAALQCRGIRLSPGCHRQAAGPGSPTQSSLEETGAAEEGPTAARHRLQHSSPAQLGVCTHTGSPGCAAAAARWGRRSRLHQDRWPQQPGQQHPAAAAAGGRAAAAVGGHDSHGCRTEGGGSSRRTGCCQGRRQAARRSSQRQLTALPHHYPRV